MQRIFIVKKLIIVVFLVVASLYLLMQAFMHDFEVNKYENMAAVHKQKALGHGWLPSLLPASAYDIVETHDIDSNDVFGKFSYKEPDEAALVAKLKPISESNDTLEWGRFLFKIDKKRNLIRFRNRPKNL